jgi:hypothetical protein
VIRRAAVRTARQTQSRHSSSFASSRLGMSQCYLGRVCAQLALCAEIENSKGAENLVASRLRAKAKM